MKAVLLVLVVGVVAGLVPREAMPARPIAQTPRVESPGGYELVCKFMDNTKARLHNLPAAATEIAQRHMFNFVPEVTIEEERLMNLIKRAEEVSGRAQPDMQALFKVNLPKFNFEAMVEVGSELEVLPSVEYCVIDTVGTPPPVIEEWVKTSKEDLNKIPEQGYLYTNPGVDAMYSLARNADGMGNIQWKDIEYAWRHSHWEFPTGLGPEPGATPSQQQWEDHGTAVGGVAMSDNTRHIQGITPRAIPGVYTEFSSEHGSRRPDALLSAAADSNLGDVILLEMQTSNPYVAAEYSRPVWDATRVASDAGVIVVATNGNGNANMDQPNYNEWMGRGDSGAIFVGAGTSNTFHNKLGFSTYGSRSDIQCWGENVYTTGYGNVRLNGTNPDYFYTQTFSGTSSAGSICAPSAIAVQSCAQQDFGLRLLPAEMRNILSSSGIPQGSGGYIGPHVDIRAACELVAKMVEDHGLEWFEVENRRLHHLLP